MTEALLSASAAAATGTAAGQASPSQGATSEAAPKGGTSSTGEQKPDSKTGGKAAEAAKAGEAEKKGDDKGKAPAGPPEKYSIVDSEKKAIADSPFMEKFTSVARKNGWSNETAQAVWSEMGPAIDEQFVEQVRSHHERQLTEWTEKTKAHPTLGGAKLKESQAVASRGFAKVPASAQALLEQYGLTNEPGMFEFFHWVGSRISPDRPVGKQAPGSATDDRPESRREMADGMYGNGKS